MVLSAVVLPGNCPLPFFDGFVVKFLDTPAVNADDVIMVRAMLQFEDSLNTLKVMPGDQSRRLELSERTICTCHLFVQCPSNAACGQRHHGACLSIFFHVFD